MILLTFTSCKLVAYEKYMRKITVYYGSSGGFTGATDTYILSGKGTLSHYNSLKKDTVFLKTIDKDVLKNLIKKFDDKAIKGINLMKSGNMNFFIRIDGNGKELRNFQWTTDTELPVEIKNLNEILQNLIRD